MLQSTNVVQQYISFVSANVGAKCVVRLTTQRPNNTQQCTTECPTNVACCILKSRARLTGALEFDKSNQG